MKRKKSSKLVNVILVLVFFLGLSLMLYPSLSDYWNSFHQSRVINVYIKEVSHIDQELYESIMESAHVYNDALNNGKYRWFLTEEERELYRSELNINNDGAMGFVLIDKIHVKLPIYHGTSENVLQSSIGHLEWTSLPVGGEGTHCVLSGHRGLPSAKLFSDLDKLREGDRFSLNVLNETLMYEIDQILIVDPDDVDELQIVPGKDYCTLFTCTPYGVNTHRLLLRGHRVDNPEELPSEVSPDIVQDDELHGIYTVILIAVPFLLVFVISMLVFTGIRTRKKKKETKPETAEESSDTGLSADDQVNSADP